MEGLWRTFNVSFAWCCILYRSLWIWSCHWKEHCFSVNILQWNYGFNKEYIAWRRIIKGTSRISSFSMIFNIDKNRLNKWNERKNRNIINILYLLLYYYCIVLNTCVTIWSKQSSNLKKEKKRKLWNYVGYIILKR